MKSQSSFSLCPHARRVLEICLILCLIHGTGLLISSVIGYQSGSLIRYTYNLEALKSFLLSISLSLLATSLTEKAFKSS